MVESSYFKADEADGANADEKKQVEHYLEGKKNKALRVHKEIQRFKENKYNTRRPNKKQRKTGADEIFKITGYIPYKNIKALYHTEKVRKELFAQNIAYNKKMKYQAILQLLKGSDTITKIRFKLFTSNFLQHFHENAMFE